MTHPHDILDRISVTTPCTADWNAMTGDARRRFCGECRLHVHDLSAMTRTEAEDLLRTAEGRTCVRFRRRPDGRVVTADCVTVRDRLRRRARRLRVAAVAMFWMVAPWFAPACSQTPIPEEENPLIDDDFPQIMGDVCIPEVEPESALEPAETAQPGAVRGYELGKVGPAQPVETPEIPPVHVPEIRGSKPGSNPGSER